MSEPTPPDGSDFISDVPIIGDEDKTQPTQDILNALRQLTSSQQTIPTSQASQQNLSQSLSQLNTSNSLEPPRSDWEALRAQVREKPTDVDAWMKLVDLSEEGGNFDQINETYEALLEAYPNTVCNSPVHISIA